MSLTSRVLVVDDDRKLADTLVTVLNQNGFDASAAYSGPAAIESAIKGRPDFIVMDVMMDELDGVDVAIAISETLLACRIVLISGHLDTFQRMSKALIRGHNFELLMKPIQFKMLFNKLRSGGGTYAAAA